MRRGQSAALVVAALVLAAFTIYSARSMTHGFVSYYAASKLLVAGKLGPLVYDDRWFGAYVQDVTASSVREIFIPNPPTMSLMALPVAWLDARTARLPKVEIRKPPELLGRSTVESIQAGLYYGNVAMLKHLCAEVRERYFAGSPTILIGTGGFARLFEDEGIFDAHVPELVLIGLREALRLNS